MNEMALSMRRSRGHSVAWKGLHGGLGGEIAWTDRGCTRKRILIQVHSKSHWETSQLCGRHSAISPAITASHHHHTDLMREDLPDGAVLRHVPCHRGCCVRVDVADILRPQPCTGQRSLQAQNHACRGKGGAGTRGGQQGRARSVCIPTRTFSLRRALTYTTYTHLFATSQTDI